MVIPEEVRSALYPLGIISTVAFTLRFLIQWMQSEKAGYSVVSAPFWWLSLLGNIALGVHSLIQGQFPVCAVQSVNAAIACRNLNLMQPHTKQWKLKTTVTLIIASFMLSIALFWFFSQDDWVRIPTHTYQTSATSLSYIWHGIGALGVVLFASRFWVQWIQAELAHESLLKGPFWWLSLVGAFFSILYFAAISDYINLVGPLFGLIPYCRNLMLLRKKLA